MATGTVSNFKVYDEYVRGGMIEVEAQASDIFNSKSAGTIVFNTQHTKGNYAFESFTKNTASLITRRVATSLSAVNDLNLTEDENISVKVSRRFQIGQTIDSLRKTMESAPNKEQAMQRFNFILGQQAAKAMQLEMLNTALSAAEAAIDNVAAVNYDNTGNSPGTLTHAALINGLSKFGDRSGDVKAWVMHSGPYFGLLGNAIGTAGFDGVATSVINTGNVPLVGRPAIISDTAALTTGSGSTLAYQILGLVPGAIEITLDAEPIVETAIITGQQNLIVRVQGEYDYKIKLKGYKWDFGNGGSNPDSSAITTGTNWDKVASDNRDTAGVHILVDG